MSAGEATGIVDRLIGWALERKLVRAYLRYSEQRGAMLADSITYRTLFSVFAGVLLGFSIAALWLAGDPSAQQALVDAVDAAIPGLVGDGGLIDVSTIQAPAGLAGVIALVGLVGAAIGAIGSMRTAMQIIAGKVRDDTFFLWVLLRNLGLALAIGGGFALSAAASIFGSSLIGFVADVAGGDSGFVAVASQLLSAVIVFVLDAGLIALAFVTLSGIRASARALWPGVLLGAFGLMVLQQLSGLFVRGASSNPLLATFASLIALLLWLNLSAQVILIASSYIVTGVEEGSERVRARFGARTFAQRRVQRAEDAVAVAQGELTAARTAAEEERRKKAKKAEKAKNA
jgi:membrane protein